MGKLLIGRYGEAPNAESTEITLRDCHQRLGLKPSDFVSDDPPRFFKKAHGALGKYLVFQLEAKEIQGPSVWRAGYYLLPLEAADVLKRFQGVSASNEMVRPYLVESKKVVPEDILERARSWAEKSQPLLIKCYCPELILHLDPPWGFRRRWGGRLTCKKRCQPPLKTQL